MNKETRESFLVRASEMLVDADTSDEKKDKIRGALEALGVADFEQGAKQIARAFQMVSPVSKEKSLKRDLKALRGRQ